MRGLLIVMVLAALIGRAQGAGIQLGIGCADPCGREVVVPGGTANCEVFVSNPSPTPDFLMIETAEVTISHGDGDEVLELVGTPIVLPPLNPQQPGANDLTLPFTFIARPADGLGTRIIAREDVGGEVLFGGTTSSGFIDFGGFASAVLVVPDTGCTATTTTVTTTTATTTTVPPPRDRRCHGNPHARWCR